MRDGIPAALNTLLSRHMLTTSSVALADGSRPVTGDIDALVDTAVRLGELFVATPELEEFELNPVFVNQRAQGLRVVDALVVSAADAQSS